MAKRDKFDVTTATLTMIYERGSTEGMTEKMYFDLITWYLVKVFQTQNNRPMIKPPGGGLSYAAWKTMWKSTVEEAVRTHYYQHNDGAEIALGKMEPAEVQAVYMDALAGMKKAIKHMRDNRLTISSFKSIRVVWIDNMETWFPVKKVGLDALIYDEQTALR